MGAEPSPRTAEIMTRSMRSTLLVSVRALSRVACAWTTVLSVTVASVAVANARARRERAGGYECDIG
jgi:hypothetical protein